MMLGSASSLLLASFSQHFFSLPLSPTLAIIIGASLFLGIINKMPLTAPLFLLEITGQSLTIIVPLAVTSLGAYITYHSYHVIKKRLAQAQTTKSVNDPHF